MHHSLPSYRFSRDRAEIYQVHGIEPRSILDAFKQGYYRNALLVSSEVTPGIEKVISDVLDVFSMSRDSVEAFVYPDASIQACCLAGGAVSAAICVSSGAVERLDHEELCFVVGHEVGHFILSHTKHYPEVVQKSPEFFECRRYQEVSADRYGLLAAGSVESAMRAIMKTASGLTSRHLRFSVQSFASQFSKAKAHLSDCTYSTHPDLPTRARALLRFDPIKKDGDLRASLNYIDVKIGKDLDAVSNFYFLEMKSELRARLITWVVLEELADVGNLTLNMEAEIVKYVGAKNLERISHLLSSEGAVYIKSLAAPKRAECLAELTTVLPFTHAEFLRGLESDVSSILSIK